MRFRQFQRGGSGVESKSFEVVDDFMRVWCATLSVGPPEEDVLIAQSKVEDNIPISILISIGSVAGKGIGSVKPLETV